MINQIPKNRVRLRTAVSIVALLLFAMLMVPSMAMAATPSVSISDSDHDGFTTTRSVFIGMTRPDHSYGYMSISNDNFATSSGWISYSSSKNWTLSNGDGVKTVYVKFAKSASGSSSTSVVSDDIKLDTTGPVISSLAPANSSSTSNTRPTIGASLSDGTNGSGVVSNNSTMKLNGVNITSGLSKSSSAVWYTSSTALSQGLYTVVVTAKDKLGNSSTATWSFNVDTVGPTVTGLNPADKSTVNNAKPTISANYNDGTGSGIDTTTVQVKLDSGFVTSGLTITSTGVQFKPTTPLTPGDHTARVFVSDKAGNQTEAVWGFTVVRPVLRMTRLAGSFLVNSSTERTYQIRFRCDNIGNGTANNIKFTASASAPASVVSVVPSSVTTLAAPGGSTEVVVKFNLNRVPKNSKLNYRVGFTYEDDAGTDL